MIFAYQKLILTSASQMIMTVWKFPVIIYLEQTIHLILNEEVFGIHYLQECINFEIVIGGKLCRFVFLYCLPNQSQDDFESFPNNFELNIDAVTVSNSFLTVVVGDFNIMSNLWFKGDWKSYEGSKIDPITSQFGLQQLINEPTHLAADFSSCIDLIFTSQPNLVMESGVHPSLHPNCHHQITYAKFNLKPTIHFHTNEKYGIMEKLMLITLEKQ